MLQSHSLTRRFPKAKLVMENAKRIEKNPTFWRSTVIAARGFLQVFQCEGKIRFAFVVLSLCLVLAFWLNVSYLETVFILVVWIQVIVGEIFNTSLEKAMDYASGKEFHPLIKRAKDYAAASVFVLSVLASSITLFILGMRLV